VNELRKIPVAVIVALAVQTVGGLVWAGGAAARIATLEEQVGEQRLVAERLARPPDPRPCRSMAMPPCGAWPT